MKIPGWSALIIVPALIFGSSFSTIRNSESPVALGLIAGGASLVIALVAWGTLALMDKWRH
jgi:hypothetical protein